MKKRKPSVEFVIRLDKGLVEVQAGNGLKARRESLAQHENLKACEEEKQL